MLVICSLVALTGLVSLLWSYKRILNLLLGLELAMLGLLGLLGFWLVEGIGDLMFMFVFIVFMIGEGVLGLRIMIRLVRVFGDDRKMRMAVLIC